jgi:hypothetical protein
MIHHSPMDKESEESGSASNFVVREESQESDIKMRMCLFFEDEESIHGS